MDAGWLPHQHPPDTKSFLARSWGSLIMEAFDEDYVVLMTGYFFKVWTVPLDVYHMEPTRLHELFSLRQPFQTYKHYGMDMIEVSSAKPNGQYESLTFCLLCRINKCGSYKLFA